MPPKTLWCLFLYQCKKSVCNCMSIMPFLSHLVSCNAVVSRCTVLVVTARILVLKFWTVFARSMYQKSNPFPYSPECLLIVSPLWGFFNINFLQGEVVSLTSNPQPGGPGYPFSSGSSPLTCLAWRPALPTSSYATASIVPTFLWPRKSHHYVEVRIPSEGSKN